VENDEFFVIATPSRAPRPRLVAMSAAIAGERQRDPGRHPRHAAHRVPMFSAVAAGDPQRWGVTMVRARRGRAAGLNIDIPPGVVPARPCRADACASCTTFSLLLAAVALRVRDTSTLTT